MQVNPSTSNWSFIATINTPEFSGPNSFLAQALSTSCYPLTFSPHIEGIIHVSISLCIVYLTKQNINTWFWVAPNWSWCWRYDCTYSEVWHTEQVGIGSSSLEHSHISMVITCFWVQFGCKCMSKLTEWGECNIAYYLWMLIAWKSIWFPKRLDTAI